MLSLHVARKNRIHLIVTIQTFVHTFLQHAIVITGQQCVPATAPDHLKDIPIGPSKGAFEFLNDLAVATHRTVEALQITVNNQYQVVEFFPRCDIDGA